MGKRDTVSLRLRPGERTAIDTVKLILEREADQDIVQTLIRQRIRESSMPPRGHGPLGPRRPCWAGMSWAGGGDSLRRDYDQGHGLSRYREHERAGEYPERRQAP